MEGDYACKYTRVLDWFREFEMNAWLDSSQEHYIDKFVLGHCAHILETQILRTFQSAQGYHIIFPKILSKDIDEKTRWNRFEHFSEMIQIKRCSCYCILFQLRQSVPVTYRYI